MDSEGLVPSLLVFKVVPTFHVTKKPLLDREDCISVSSTGHAGVATITAELKIVQAITSNVPPFTHFFFDPGENVGTDKELQQK